MNPPTTPNPHSIPAAPARCLPACVWIAALGLFFLLPTPRADAAVILQYHLNGSDSFAPSNAAAFVSASDDSFIGSATWRTEFTDAGATPAGPLAGSSAGSKWRLFYASATPATPDSNDARLQFTVTYTGTQSLALDTLRFDWALAISTGNGGIIMQWTAFASINGGAFTPVDSEAGLSFQETNGWSEVTTAAADVSALPVLLPGDSIEIRVAVADNSGAGNKGVFLQGVQLEGVQIFAPAPAALPAGLGLLAIAAMRRRRK